MARAIPFGKFVSIEAGKGRIMISELVAFCTSYTGQLWLILASDLIIAVAYFAIPVTMAVVLRDRRADIPYPWLWTLFVTFIVACGLTHLVHVWSAYQGVEYRGLQTAIEVFTAFASIGTAVAFVWILPQIKDLPSPIQQREILQREVAERTKEKDHLILEINHRIGNQLQILGALVAREKRDAKSPEVLAALERFNVALQGMGEQHLRLSRENYLGTGLAGDMRSVLPPTTAAAGAAPA
ncbi:MAG: hypothetical protein JO245_11660 [Pseudolabrys sp.]|nr:hypothetical protein [Pseudolabrys sp.]